MLDRTEIKRLQTLRDQEVARRSAGMFIVEGEKAVREYLREDRFRIRLYSTAEVADAGRAEVILITPLEMARITHLPSPSTMLALIHRLDEPAPAADSLKQGYTLALDAVQDPGNVGTLIRIADWYGFACVLLGEGCADPYFQKVVNASKGSLARMAVHRVDLPAMLARVDGVAVLGCDLDGENIHAIASTPAAIVVIGSEGRGLSPEVAAHVTKKITIPSFGTAESLNAAIAGAIVCDNLRRAR